MNETEKLKTDEAPAESVLMKLLERLKCLSDSAYIEILDIAKTNPCLGWEAKVRAGQFGRAEMDAHRKSNLAMGQYIGYAAAMRVIRELL